MLNIPIHCSTKGCLCLYEFCYIIDENQTLRLLSPATSIVCFRMSRLLQCHGFSFGGVIEVVYMSDATTTILHLTELLARLEPNSPGARIIIWYKPMANRMLFNALCLLGLQKDCAFTSLQCEICFPPQIEALRFLIFLRAS